MKSKNIHELLPTNDLIIRSALREELKKLHGQDKELRIIEELGVSHGAARIDIAVVNGIIHGYEIKSDLDTLQRLPEQMSMFNAVFDKVTLVVGKSHLYSAINMIPDWWGIIVAKVNLNGSIIFNVIREGENNKGQDSLSVARLLWREEALKILEESGKAQGFYSKPRASIYEKLSTVLDQKTLNAKVRETIFIRSEWRLDAPLMTNGG
ncbi:MAG TPA: sce7726 family protein [Smithellaceae bacterium]|nr:sce7726 family protein [Smithellaceae bacterium]